MGSISFSATPQCRGSSQKLVPLAPLRVSGSQELPPWVSDCPWDRARSRFWEICLCLTLSLFPHRERQLSGGGAVPDPGSDPVGDPLRRWKLEPPNDVQDL